MGLDTKELQHHAHDVCPGVASVLASLAERQHAYLIKLFWTLHQDLDRLDVLSRPPPCELVLHDVAQRRLPCALVVTGSYI